MLPRCDQEVGGIDGEALRKAALTVDIPTGGTIQGYGVKFYPPEAAMAGQNDRSIAVVMQFDKGKSKVVWPAALGPADRAAAAPRATPTPPGDGWAAARSRAG